MQNLLPDARYTINFIGKDKDKLVDMLSIIGSDKTARFHNGRWSVLGGTLSSIIAVVDKSLLDIKEEIELGTELQSGYKLYPFQKDFLLQILLFLIVLLSCPFLFFALLK